MATKKPASYYQRVIADLVPAGVDPRHVEAYMRVARSTLGDLPPRLFRREVGIALECIEQGGIGAAERCARSFGF